MADSFDVAARLAEGQAAVDDVSRYVAACQRLGYQHPDLTAHTAQVRDWYAGEDGLDLRALDADCAVLSAVAAAAADAARQQTVLVTALSTAWSGTAASAGHEFTSRSAESANAVSDAIRAAADANADLRDALWSAVDAKVAAVQSIDGRQQAHRPEWLAAAETVTTGAGDLAAASELVDQQVKPFVVDDVGSDWLTAMRTARASIDQAFDTALTGMAAAKSAVFAVPGELGPRPEVSETAAPLVDSRPESAAAATVPAAVFGAAAPSAGWPASPPAQPMSWPAPGPMGTAPLAETAALPESTVPASLPAGAASTPSLGELGGGASGLGGGLSGFGQQLADLIGSLVGSADGGVADQADVGFDGPGLDDDPALDDEDAEDDEPEDVGAEDSEGPEDASPEDASPEDASPEDVPPVEESADVIAEPATCPEETDGSTGQPPLVPAAVAPPIDSPLPPAAVPESLPASTPCEIAADELPQVGE